MHSLLVEDDAAGLDQTTLHMRRMGFAVSATDCPFAARVLFSKQSWDLVIIHLGSAQDESLNLCRWIRAESTVPIIMLTSRDEIIDEVMALNAGADDYAVMPLSPHILTARVAHQLKRSQRSVTAPRENQLRQGPLMMDLDQYRFFVHDIEVVLTKSEFQIMRLLLENPSLVLSRRQFLVALDILPGVGSDHIVDTHASRLRAKIRRHGGGNALTSVRGVGFRLAGPDSVR
jgi:DNA-binding response OmpR family regulator